jgi:hypothetical protein
MGTKQTVPAAGAIACLLLLLGNAVADRTQVLAVNPQKTAQIQRHQVGDNIGGLPQTVEITDAKTGAVLCSFSSIWRSTDGEWSPDGTLVFINDRTATSGDFLYIFRLDGAKVVAIRKPGDDSFFKSLSSLYEKLKPTGRMTVAAREWLDNSSLQVRVGGGGYGGNQTFDITVRIDPAGHLDVDPLSEEILN